MARKPKQSVSKRDTITLTAMELLQLKTDLTKQVEEAARKLLFELRDELGIAKAQQTMAATAKEAAHAAIKETFTTIGIDISNPILAQETFSALRKLAAKFSEERFQQDLDHLRTWRLVVQRTFSKASLAITGAAVAAIIAIFWLGTQMAIKQVTHGG